MGHSKKIFTAFVLAVFAFAGTAFADQSYTLQDNVTGAHYFCGTGGPTQPTDPNCIQSISDYCTSSTSNTPSACFDKATQACAGQGSPVSQTACSRTATYCTANTSMTPSDCLDRALSACRGSDVAITALMRSAHDHGAAVAAKTRAK